MPFYLKTNETQQIYNNSAHNSTEISKIWKTITMFIYMYMHRWYTYVLTDSQQQLWHKFKMQFTVRDAEVSGGKQRTWENTGVTLRPVHSGDIFLIFLPAHILPLFTSQLTGSRVQLRDTRHYHVFFLEEFSSLFFLPLWQWKHFFAFPLWFITGYWR